MLPDRLRPRHALPVVAFLLGAALPLATSDLSATASLGHLALSLYVVTVEGLLAAVICWGFVSYVVAYREAGGGWLEPVFLFPLVAAALAMAAVLAADLGAWSHLGWRLFGAAQVAFAAFAVAVGLVAVGRWVRDGYEAGLRG